MGTRGLVVIKHKGKARAYYNQFDSYPSVLMTELATKLSRLSIGYSKEVVAKTLGSFVEGRCGHNVNMNWPIKLPVTKRNHPNIDYLFHEYVYLIDLDKEKWQAFKSIWKEDSKRVPPGKWDVHKGHLKPLSKVLTFRDPVKIEQQYGKKGYISGYKITQKTHTIVRKHPRKTKRKRTTVRKHPRKLPKKKRKSKRKR